MGRVVFGRRMSSMHRVLAEHSKLLQSVVKRPNPKQGVADRDDYRNHTLGAWAVWPVSGAGLGTNAGQARAAGRELKAKFCAPASAEKK